MEFHEKSRQAETDLWQNYFSSNYDFEIVPGDPPTVRYKDTLNEGRILVFDSSFIDVELEAVK